MMRYGLVCSIERDDDEEDEEKESFFSVLCVRALFGEWMNVKACLDRAVEKSGIAQGKLPEEVRS